MPLCLVHPALAFHADPRQGSGDGRGGGDAPAPRPRPPDRERGAPGDGEARGPVARIKTLHGFRPFCCMNPPRWFNDYGPFVIKCQVSVRWDGKCT